MNPDAAVTGVPAAPWSLVLGQFGQGCVIAALLLQVVATILWVVAPSKPAFEPWAKRAFTLGCLAFFAAFAVVVSLFVQDQYQFKYVFAHGARDNELKYKIAGAWSGQEGSFLLWGVMSALFGMLAAPAAKQYRRWFTLAYAPFLAALAAILAYESPFALRALVNGQVLVPETGNGLSPSLLNYWVIIHPPTIFAGFGSLTVMFAFAVAALATLNLVDWVALVRPWALVSMTLLGVGLAMGGFWAYETLGWGGFWMWDPVENTSFVPWVAIVALIHGVMVQVSRQKWHYTNVLLAGLPFLLFCYGTFLTRSGFLGDTSVHSFAEMDRSALKILIGVIIAGYVGFIVLWAHRTFIVRPTLPMSRDMHPAPVNREVTIGTGIWLLVMIGVFTAIGMSIPFLQTMTGQKPRVVEEPVYNTVLSLLFLPLMIIMAVGPFITWRGLGMRALLLRFVNVFSISIMFVGFTLLWVRSGILGIPANLNAKTNLFMNVPFSRVAWVMILTWFCLFGIVATLWKLYENFKKSKSGVGGMLAHFGVGVAMLGLIFSRGLEQRSVNPAAPTDPTFLISPTGSAEQLGFAFSAIGPTSNFVDRNNKVEVKVEERRRKNDFLLGFGNFRLEPPPPGKPFIVKPGLYYNGINEEGKPTPFIWPAIYGRGTYDLYLVLHDIVFEASGETEMKVGEKRLLKDENMLVTYNGMRSEGEPGKAGAKFFAKVNVQTQEGEWNVEPMITLTDHGMEQTPAKVGEKYRISFNRMDAADKSAVLQVKYAQPAYIAELYYKPLTLLVWLGVGIMTLGGAVTAWTRRTSSNKPLATEAEPNPESEG